MYSVMQKADKALQVPLFSVVVPVKNEEGNVALLVSEIAGIFAGEAARALFTKLLADETIDLDLANLYEMIFVDDGSTDSTRVILNNLRATYSNLRVLQHEKNGGQSAAIRSGASAARGAFIATLDGDGQNNPAFLPPILALLLENAQLCEKDPSLPILGLVQGQRVGRKDTAFKRWQSRMANRIRGAILQDGTRDTGCGLKAFRRDAYFALPYFDALHRFMPALVKREGFTLAHYDVIDRPRHSGVSNYGFWGRLRVGIFDLYGVWWLIKRKKLSPKVREETRSPPTEKENG